MNKTYICKLCGEEIRSDAVPKIIAKEELCTDCYRTKYRAFGSTLKQFIG